jgi:tellurite resistance protein
MHEQNLAILKGLVAVAWADGRVTGQEQEVLEALLEAFGATPSEAAEVRSFARQRRTLEDVPLTDLGYDDRRVLLQQAVVLTYIDGEQHESERELLEDLAQRLRIPASETAQLLSLAADRTRGLVDLL